MLHRGTSQMLLAMIFYNKADYFALAFTLLLGDKVDSGAPQSCTWSPSRPPVHKFQPESMGCVQCWKRCKFPHSFYDLIRLHLPEDHP